jgi:hypothetical protein
MRPGGPRRAQRSVAGRPNQVARTDAREIRTSLGELEPPTLRELSHGEERPSWLLLLGSIRVEADARARDRRRHRERETRERAGRARGHCPLQPADPHRVVSDLGHFAQQRPTVLGETTLHQRLMIHSLEKPGAEPPRERHRHATEIHLERPERLGGACSAFGDRRAPAPVALHRRRHVRGALEAPFDLERGHPQRDELGERADASEIQRAQRILERGRRPHLPVHHQAVRQPARLGALAAVGRTPAPGLRGETLTAPRHAQCAVDEDLELERRLLGEVAELGHRQLPRRDQSADTETDQKLGRPRARDGPLGGGVDRQRGSQCASQQRHRRILDDHRVHPGPSAGGQALLDLRKFVLENQGIQGDECPSASAMDSIAHLPQPRQGDTGGARPGIRSVVKTEVDAVGARRQRGAQAVIIAGRSEDLGAFVVHPTPGYPRPPPLFNSPMDARAASSTDSPLSRLIREPAEETDEAGNRTIRHGGPGIRLVSRVDRQGRLLRQELLLETDVLIWQHGTRVRTGICSDGNIAANTQYDATPSRIRLERARLASQSYRGEDKYVRHLARVVALSAGLSMGGAEVVTHSDGGGRRKRQRDAEASSRRRLLLIVGAGVLIALVSGFFLLRSL